MKRRIAVLITILITVSFCLAQITTPAMAAVGFPLSSVSGTCSRFGASGTFSSGDANPRWVGLTVFVDPDDDGFILFEDIHVGTIGGGTTSGSFNSAIAFPQAANGTHIYIDISTYVAPYTSFSQFFSDYDGEQYVFGNYYCLQPPGPIGPPIPEGAELKTIICDVAVFDSAGGRPVGSNALKNGQTWYVLPGVKTGERGDGTVIEWSEVFVGGYTNGWIPTACVQDANRGEAEEKTTTGGGGQTVAPPPVNLDFGERTGDVRLFIGNASARAASIAARVRH